MEFVVKPLIFKMERVVISLLFVCLLNIQVLKCALENSYPQKTCAILYSRDEGKGSKIKFGEQLIKIPDVQRGFFNCTGSIKVAPGCKMKMWDASPLNGTCETLEEGNYYQSNLSRVFEGPFGFVECTCSQVSNGECKCADIFMKKSSNYCARAYFKGGCNNCHTPYFELTGIDSNWHDFPNKFVGKVEALRLRKGCNLTLYSEQQFVGVSEIISSEVLENYKGAFTSHKCECSDTTDQLRDKRPPPAYYPVSLNIPFDKVETIELMKTIEFQHHPGLELSFQSYENARSSRNAYILLLGESRSGKTSTLNLLLGMDNRNFGLNHPLSTDDACPDPYPPHTTEINEHRIKTPVNELGIGNSELRIIDTPGLFYYNNVTSDANMLVSLEHFLSTHEDLKTKFPNVILIFHTFFYDAYKKECNTFLKMLKVYKTLLEKIADKNNSNVIFVFSKYCSESESLQLNPIPQLNEFKEAIENYFSLPRPTILVVAENNGRDLQLPMIDGYYSLPNKELYPKNLIDKMYLVTQNGQDLIGQSIFRRVFDDLNFEPSEWKTVSHPIATNESVTVNQHIHNFANLCVSKTLNYTQPAFINNPIAGFGYHLFNDTQLITSPFQQGNLRQSDIGFRIPNFLSANLIRSLATNFYIFDSQREYIEHRLANFGLKGKLPQETINWGLKPGHNIKIIAFRNDSCTLRFTRDFKLFQFLLNDIRDFTNEFLETVYKLPRYTENDAESVEEWNEFFNEYGTHVVHSVYGGGSIQIEVHGDTECNTEIGHAFLDMIYFTEGKPFLVVGQNNGSTKRLFKEGISYSLTFLGGDSQFAISNSSETLVDDAAMSLSKWKKSLRTSPVALPASEMKLLALNQVVEGLGYGFSKEIQRAINLHFKSTIKPLKGNEETQGVLRSEVNFIQETLVKSQKIREVIHELFQNFRKQHLEDFSMLMEQLSLDRGRENEQSVNMSIASKIREFVGERKQSEYFFDRLGYRARAHQVP